MAVNPKGRAYVTQFGYDLFNHAPPAATDWDSEAPIQMLVAKVPAA